MIRVHGEESEKERREEVLAHDVDKQKGSYKEENKDEVL